MEPMKPSEFVHEVARHLSEWRLAEIKEEDVHPSASFEYAGLDTRYRGARFKIQRVWNDETRYKVYGDYPRSRRNESYAEYAVRFDRKKIPQPGFSPSRGGKAIARDLERRFIGPFLEIWHRAEKMREDTEEAERRRFAISEDLAALFGLKGKDKNMSGYPESKFRYYGGGQDAKWPGFEVEVDYRGMVTLKLSDLAPERAKRVLEVFRDWTEEESERLSLTASAGGDG